VSTTLRYIDDVEFDANEFSFQRFFPFSNFRSVDRIDAWKQMDVFYSYRGLQLPSIGGDLSFTLGARSVTDREAQKVGMTSGSVQELHDPLGRVIYGRINYQFQQFLTDQVSPAKSIFRSFHYYGTAGLEEY